MAVSLSDVTDELLRPFGDMRTKGDYRLCKRVPTMAPHIPERLAAKVRGEGSVYGQRNGAVGTGGVCRLVLISLVVDISQYVG